MADWTYWLGVVRDVAAIVGSIGLVIIGAIGLGVWRKQLAGTTEYQLAKNILTVSYRVQDTMQAVRNPMLYLSKEAADQGKRVEEEQRVYGERLDRLAAVRTELRTLALESRAVWGQDGQEEICGLNELIGTLHADIWLHLWLKGAYVQPGAHVDNNPERVAKNNAVVYYTSDDDEFSLKLAGVVADIESKYQDKLKH